MIQESMFDDQYTKEDVHKAAVECCKALGYDHELVGVAEHVSGGTFKVYGRRLNGYDYPFGDAWQPAKHWVDGLRAAAKVIQCRSDW